MQSKSKRHQYKEDIHLDVLFLLVRLKGLEPTRITAREPKSRMSTNSITGAYMSGRVTCRYFIQNKKEEFEKCEIRGLTLSVCDFSAQSAMKSQICICA